jgi:hypothetical protein
MRNIVNAALMLAVLIVLPSVVAAEKKIGFRQITIVEPVAIQRGTSQKMTLRSNYTLDGTHSIFFDKPGVEMKFAETKPKPAPRKGRGSDGTPFNFDVTAAANAQPGVFELRVATDQAVSSVSHLIVTDHPVFHEDEKKSNNTRETAQKVSIPVAICGRTERFEDVDHFSFEGTAGQELTFEIRAQRATEAIHGMVVRGPLIYLMDSLLTLHGPNGQVVAQNDNFFGGDSFIHIKLPEDGTYSLEIRDARYAGSGRYVYCVEISDTPYAHAVFPLAVQQGQSSPATLVGHLIGESHATELKSDQTDKLGWKNQRFETANGRTNPVGFLVSPNPQMVTGNKNSSIKTAQTIQFPIGISGRFSDRDGAHYFSFDAKKNQFYKFEVRSRQLGLPLDSVLEIYSTDGKLITEADDYLQTKDSKLYWQATADSKFVISIRDLHGRGGERFIYHLNAEVASPDFELHGEYYYAQMAPGIRMMWFAKIVRLNGFDGPVEIVVQNLPKGVTAEPVTIPKGMLHCAVILSAAQDAPINASLARVVGLASVKQADGKETQIVRRGRITCEQQGSGGGQARWPIHTQVVGVTKPLDLLEVTATPSKIKLKPGEKAEIKVRVKRQAGFADPITLAMSFDYFKSKFGEQLPPGVSVGKASKLRLAGKNLEGTIVLEASDKAVEVQNLPIAALARVSITFSITTNYASNPIYLTIEK